MTRGVNGSITFRVKSQMDSKSTVISRADLGNHVERASPHRQPCLPLGVFCDSSQRTQLNISYYCNQTVEKIVFLCFFGRKCKKCFVLILLTQRPLHFYPVFCGDWQPKPTSKRSCKRGVGRSTCLTRWSASSERPRLERFSVTPAVVSGGGEHRVLSTSPNLYRT